jgi:hypothetical protein
MRSEVTAERVAENQSTFREANERIEAAAAAMTASELPTVPFICECPDPRCTAIARLTLDDYEVVRGHGEWFFAVPGHEVCSADGVEVARVVKRYETHTVLEKVGAAGDVARRLDPRSD